MLLRDLEVCLLIIDIIVEARIFVEGLVFHIDLIFFVLVMMYCVHWN